MIDATGKVPNPTFRGYHIPAFADIPRTQVYFADTYDRIGPLGAKSMSESHPVATPRSLSCSTTTSGKRGCFPPSSRRMQARMVTDREAVFQETEQPRRWRGCGVLTDATGAPARAALYFKEHDGQTSL
jgi:hypothetical protein